MNAEGRRVRPLRARERRRRGVLARVASRGRHHRVRWSRCRAGSPSCCEGWRPITEATADERVDDRVDRGQPRRVVREDRRAACRRSCSPSRTDATVHLAWGPEEEAFRAELVAFLDEHAPPEARVRRDFADTDGGPARDLIPQWARDWQATLFDHGWMIPGYPPELGGRNCTPVQTLVYLEEMASARHAAVGPLPRLRDRRAEPARVRHDEQQRALAPAAIRGDTVWCIGMSEPNAGSDLAGAPDPRRGARRPLRRQRPEGLDVLRDGCAACAAATCAPIPTRPSTRASACSSSTWTRPGSRSGRCATSPAAADFAEVFFTDVVVPRENLVGGLNDGWRLTQGSLAHERAGLWVEGVARLEQTHRRARRPRPPPGCRRRSDRAPAHRRGLPARLEPPRARLQGLHELRAGLVGARALVHEDGDVRARQGARSSWAWRSRGRTARSPTPSAARSRAAGCGASS